MTHRPEGLNPDPRKPPPLPPRYAIWPLPLGSPSHASPLQPIIPHRPCPRQSLPRRCSVDARAYASSPASLSRRLRSPTFTWPTRYLACRKRQRQRVPITLRFVHRLTAWVLRPRALSSNGEPASGSFEAAPVSRNGPSRSRRRRLGQTPPAFSGPGAQPTHTHSLPCKCAGLGRDLRAFCDTRFARFLHPSTYPALGLLLLLASLVVAALPVHCLFRVGCCRRWSYATHTLATLRRLPSW